MAYSDAATHTQSLSALHNLEFKDARVEALQAKLAETTLDVERARMSAEDALGAMTSPYQDNQGRYLSWRGDTKIQRGVNSRMWRDIIFEGRDVLSATRLALYEYWRPSRRIEEWEEVTVHAALTNAYRGMTETLSCVGQREVGGQA